MLDADEEIKKIVKNLETDNTAILSSGNLYMISTILELAVLRGYTLGINYTIDRSREVRESKPSSKIG